MSDALLAELGIRADELAARGLRRVVVADMLVVAETGRDGREHRLTPAAAEAWRRLKQAARRDGELLYIVSAFRSVERQAEIIRRKLDAGGSIEKILAVCAAPGYSEHHTGRAVDVSASGLPPLEVEFEQSSAFDWLHRNAGRFDFTLSYPRGNSLGYEYEPWHWCHGSDPSP